ncbi:MAG: Crp/Fnr family transcriptional regulator [Bacteroidota bacterium]
MDTNPIYKSLNTISPLTQEAWADFEYLLEPMELGRNEFLVREGSRVNHCYLLSEGVVRVFNSNEGNEYNKTFFIPGMFPTPLTALLSSTPVALSFQALLPSKLIRFSYQKFRELFEKHRCWETFMLRVLEREWINKELHDIRMVTNDATTNYLIFRETYPDLENQIPQYHIASYLGITPIQLSRIRAQLAKSG